MRKQDKQRRPPTEELLWAAATSWNAGDPALHDRLVAALTERGGEAAAAVERHLQATVERLWERGWTPADVVHVAGREQSAAHADAAAELVVADARRRRRGGQALHPRWEAQVDALDVRRLLAGDLGTSVALLGLLSPLPDLPRTIPAPGTTVTPAERLLGTARGLDERMLVRVRALLAKAESTEFDEEAEALTAKAQELIARHAIDDALLHAPDDVGEPSARRIPVPDPYADAKAALYAAIAGANRARVVESSGFGWITVIGYDGDLDAVELLAASLLAQATGAIARQGSVRDAVGRSRTRSFRRSFLLGFAHRIGQRLADATEGQIAGAADQSRLLPVLTVRDDRLDAATQAAFPQLVSRTRSVSNAGGWVAGQAAADMAELGVSAGALHGSPP